MTEQSFLLYFHRRINLDVIIRRPSTWYSTEQKEIILNYTITVTLQRLFTCTSKRKYEDIVLC